MKWAFSTVSQKKNTIGYKVPHLEDIEVQYEDPDLSSLSTRCRHSFFPFNFRRIWDSCSCWKPHYEWLRGRRGALSSNDSSLGMSAKKWSFCNQNRRSSWLCNQGIVWLINIFTMVCLCDFLKKHLNRVFHFIKHCFKNYSTKCETIIASVFLNLSLMKPDIFCISAVQTEKQVIHHNEIKSLNTCKKSTRNIVWTLKPIVWLTKTLSVAIAHGGLEKNVLKEICCGIRSEIKFENHQKCQSRTCCKLFASNVFLAKFDTSYRYWFTIWHVVMFFMQTLFFPNTLAWESCILKGD